jgi:serine/threonine-protein kinase
MACVFRATDLRSGRQVAIKVPHPEAECDIAFHDRFLREAQIGQELSHPAIMRVFEAESPSRLYMVMEWVEGRPLREILAQEKRLPAERAVRIVAGICGALDYIHTHGVVHRDLKPENVIVDAEDQVKLIDFGIAAKAGARRLTFGKLSNVMGTADYISPEQVGGGRGDARSDVYALGSMLYEMLTGEAPFRGPNALAVMNARLRMKPDPPSRIAPGLPKELDAIVCRALARKPADRYAAARDMAYDLENPEQAASAARPAETIHEMPGARVRKILVYGALAMLPVAILLLMMVVGRIG